MDEQTRRDMETMAEWASTMDAYDRLLERRARRRRTLKFWLSPMQVADEPYVAVPTPGASAPSALPGVGSGAVGSETHPLPHTNRTGFADPAGPQTTPLRPGTGRGPATPHLEAVRLSGAHTWT